MDPVVGMALDYDRNDNVSLEVNTSTDLAFCTPCSIRKHGEKSR